MKAAHRQVQALAWWVIGAVFLLGCGLIVLLLWIESSERRQRRKARVARQIAASYRRHRTRELEASQPVTVNEPVQRIEAEGLPTRLAQEEDDEADDGPDEDDWPTEVLPRIE